MFDIHKAVTLHYLVIPHKYDPTLTTAFNANDNLNLYDLILMVDEKNERKLFRNVTKEQAYDAAHYHAARFGNTAYTINGNLHNVSDIALLGLPQTA